MPCSAIVTDMTDGQTDKLFPHYSKILP